MIGPFRSVRAEPSHAERCKNGGMTKSAPDLTQGVTARADLTKKPTAVSAMFDQVASRYDLMNAVASLGQVYVWRRALVNALDPQPGEKILDLAAGTGTSSAALVAGGAHVIACDLSPGMIQVGRERHPELEFVLGDATDLPFQDDQFDAVTISFGLRNVQDVPAALREMLRVTKPGGTLLICEFSTPTNRFFRGAYDAYLGTVMPVAARAFSSDDVAYDYLVESILDWPDQEALGRLLQVEGWRGVEVRNLAGGIVAMHRARKPE